MSLEVGKKKLYCAMSLFKIAEDLKTINPMISQICVSLSKNLIEELKKEDVPEAVVHSEAAPHNTGVAEEIESIIAEIKAAEV